MAKDTDETPVTGYVNHFETARTKKVRADESVFIACPPGSAKSRMFGCRCSETQVSGACPVHMREVMANG